MPVKNKSSAAMMASWQVNFQFGFEALFLKHSHLTRLLVALLAQLNLNIAKCFAAAGQDFVVVDKGEGVG